MFLADENFPRPSILLLRQEGWNVKSIQEKHSGISDREVVLIAQQTGFIILTFDRDYGEIVFRHGAINPPAVIYFRNKEQHPLFAGQILLKLLREEISFKRCFTVIEAENFRQRFYK